VSNGQVEDAANKELEDQLDSWEWRNGHRPRGEADWFAEVRAIEENYTQYANQQWRLGRPPENPKDWDHEFRLRDIEQRWESERDDRKRQADYELMTRRDTAKGENMRSWVLLLVIAGIVLTPIYAMIAGVEAEAFGKYIAPITGIAGTVIGYWFGQRGGQANVPAPDRQAPSLEATRATKPTVEEGTPASPKPGVQEVTPPSAPAPPKSSPD
jgi:hypothetical protein